MTDPDDDALSWAGDDRQTAPRPAAVRTAAPRSAPSGGAVTLLVTGVLIGVAVLETVFWVRGLLLPTIIATLGRPEGAGETAAYWATVAGRVLAAAAPAVWCGVVLWRVRPAATRTAWLLLGAVLLVPWPFVLGAL